MKLSITHKILSILLTVLLFLAPVEAALSGDFYSHLGTTESSANQLISTSIHHMDASKNLASSDHHHGDHEVDENSCQSQCANCVYCSAANVMSNSISLSVYESVAPEVNINDLKSIDISVDIRPPIYS